MNKETPKRLTGAKLNQRLGQNMHGPKGNFKGRGSVLSKVDRVNDEDANIVWLLPEVNQQDVMKSIQAS